MKIKITRNTVANKVAVVDGQIVEVPDNEGKFLIGIGKAVAVETKGKAEQIIETADLQPEVETADVKHPRSKKG